MPKPDAVSRPVLAASGPDQFRIIWAIPEGDPEVTACTVKVRIAGSQRYQNYDHKTGRLVPKGGSTVPTPLCEVTVDGCLEGIEYEAVVAAMNSEGWGDVSQPSEPVSIGEAKPRDKPPAPLIPTLVSAAQGKLKCTWELPEACPPVEASQVRLTDVAKGVSMLVDAAKGQLVESGRTTLAAPKCEVTINGVKDSVEYIASVCCRNAEGMGEYSMPSDGAVSGIDPKAAAGMALVLHHGPSEEVPILEPMPSGEGRMKIKWLLPEDAKSTMVKLRRVGEKNWRLVGGTAIPKPACEVFATGLEEGLEYEATISFMLGGRWRGESKTSRPACIGTIKKPGLPDAPKEPILYSLEGIQKMRCKWKTPTAVPPVNAIFVRVRAVGGDEWFYVPANTGMPQADEGEPVHPPTSELDIVGLHPGVRYEAQIILRNRLGKGEPSYPSEASCIGRPVPRMVKCQYCFTDFDLQHAEYTKAAEHFWCPACRFRNMDPFNAVVEPYGMLVCKLVTRPQMTFDLELPDLKAWRKEEHNVQMRMVRINSDNCSNVWPMTVTVEANGNEVFKVIPPEEGHVRRDVPRNIAGGVKPGSNRFVITIQDPHLAGFAMALVHTYPRSVQQISQDITVCGEELARERVCALLHENWAADGPVKADPDEDREDGEEGDDDDEISCVISNKLKLRCPLSFERVTIPVRGDSCVHLQCFGLGAYLESNVKMRALNNRWTCPVCGNPLRPKDLRIDGYVEKVLKDTPEHVDEVEILPGADYKVVEEQSEGKQLTARLNVGKANDAAMRAEEKNEIAEIGGEEGIKRKEAPGGQPLIESRKKRKQRLMTVGEEDGNGSGDDNAAQPTGVQ